MTGLKILSPTPSLVCSGRRVRGTVLPAELGYRKDRFPSAEIARLAVVLRGRVAEACGNEGALGPAVVDVCEVPVDAGRRGVAVELVADVDQVLD